MVKYHEDLVHHRAHFMVDVQHFLGLNLASMQEAPPAPSPPEPRTAVVDAVEEAELDAIDRAKDYEKWYQSRPYRKGLTSNRNM